MRHLLLIVLTLLLPACSPRPKAGPAQAALAFLTNCTSGKIPEAYGATASMFRFGISRNYFEARVKDMNLDKAAVGAPGTPEPQGETTRVPFELAFKDGRRMAIFVILVEEQGEWRVLHAKTAPTDPKAEIEDLFAVATRSTDTDRINIVAEPVARAIPAEPHLQRLVEESTQLFANCILKNDFKPLFEFVSDRWRYRGKAPHVLNYTGTDRALLAQSDPLNLSQRITLEAMNNAFKGFVEQKADLTPLKGKKMTLDEPARITSDGVLLLIGHYDDFVFIGNNEPRRLIFTLEWVFEGGSWKSFGLSYTAPQIEKKK